MDCVSSSGDTPVRATPKGSRVVVAERDPVVAGTISWLLREHGFSVSTAADRAELFKLIESDAPDLIVLDGSVAQRDVGVLSDLRANERCHDVRVVVTTPWPAGNADEGLPTGADDWVSKPLRVSELLGRVRTQLRASDQLRAAKSALRDTTVELERVREDAANNRRLVEILHEITGELAASEIYRVLARRIARALGVPRAVILLARPGEPTGMLAVAQGETVQGPEVRLESYPEVATAIASGRPLLIEDGRGHPLFAKLANVPGAGREGTRAEIRSSAAIPFAIDRWRSGALLLRTLREERALTAEDVSFVDGVMRAAVAVIRRAQALETTRAENRRLEALATTDPLTRVLNRRALLDRLTAECDRARRYDSSLALLLFDIDHFKEINDTAGHLAGDSVLRQLGALLADAMRKVDVLARYGGEEFVAMLPETSMEGAAVFAERLRERIAAQVFDIGGQRSVRLTVSIGLATFPSSGVASTDDLFARADEALYRAKSGGRNQVRT
jgi:two-component system cell cycle response regulator